ncbi:MAG: hypothetical protein KAR33_00060 [Candidatus Thorarchaeota archaeon]|nr:hypothetical protein [Candidatus Thorarchaeota archaeon]
MLDDLQVYFKGVGKILPPGMLEDSLVTIGVPRSKRIISDTKDEEEKPIEVAKPEPKIEPEIEEPVDEIDKEPENDSKVELEPIELKSGIVSVIDDKDLPDIEDALTAVESLSDSFMAPTTVRKENAIPVKPQIRISLKGFDEVVASHASTATDPNLIISEEGQDEITSEAIDIPTGDLVQDAIDVPEEVVTDKPEMTGSIPLEEATSPRGKKTPSHAIRPLVSAKAVILGEDGVGKHSLMEKAGLKIQVGPEIDGDPKEYIHSGIFRLEDYRVDIEVWSFDDAVNAKVSRKEFYRDVEVIIIVYAVPDRWSFESIDFWLREATVKQQVPPPILLVGNKKDIRDTGDPDPLEPAVTSDEGFKLAETLAKRMGMDNKLHPVAFIETSCLTGEGAEDVFRTASEFYTNTL